MGVAAYVPAPPDPLGEAMGRMFAQGLSNFFMGMSRNRDTKKIEDWLRFNQGAQGSQNWLADTSGFVGAPEFAGQVPPQQIGQTPFPRMNSPWGQDVQQQVLMRQIENMLPLSDFKRAQLEGMRAQTEYQRAHARSLGMPEPQYSEPFSVNGTTLQRGPDGRIHVVDKSVVPSVERELHDKALAAGLQPGTLEYQRFTKGPTQADQYSMPNLVRNFGFTPPEAKTVRDIHYGLLPRATTDNPQELLNEYNQWLSIYTKSTFEPGFGQRGEMPELQSVADAALNRINVITEQMKKQGVPIPQPTGEGTMGNGQGQPVPFPQTTAPGGPGPAPTTAAKLMELNRMERFSVPVPLLLTKYPTLAEKLPGLTPPQRAEILETVKAGFSEDEILSCFK